MKENEMHVAYTSFHTARAHASLESSRVNCQVSRAFISTAVPATLGSDRQICVKREISNQSMGNASLETFHIAVAHNQRKEMFYLTTHSTHCIYCYMASDIWLRKPAAAT